jgi:hypothetical protein
MACSHGPGAGRAADGAGAVFTTSCGLWGASRLSKVTFCGLVLVSARLTSLPCTSLVTSALVHRPAPNGPEVATGSPAAGALLEVMLSSSQVVLATWCTE